MRRSLPAHFRWFVLQSVFAIASVCITIASLGRWRAWRRNSLVLGYWSENSDLDLTLYSDSEVALTPRLLKLWSFFRRAGEWAVYASADKKWAQYSNPFELRRDPKLEKTFSPSKIATKTEAFVFWLRMRDSDVYLNQIEKISTRERKWEHHRKVLENELGIRCRKLFPDSVLEMGESLSPVPSSQWADLEHILRPHRWIAGARQSGQPLDGILAKTSPELIDIARSQIHWEIWGLLGQIRLRQNWEEVKQHLIHLAQLFPEGDAIHTDIDEFLNHLESFQSR